MSRYPYSHVRLSCVFHNSLPLLQNIRPIFFYCFLCLFLQLHHSMRNVTANLFPTTPVCLLICQIPCDLVTLPATSLNKFLETMLLRVSSISIPSPYQAACSPHARSSLSSSFNFTPFSHCTGGCKVHWITVQIPRPSSQRFPFNRLGWSPDPVISAKTSGVPEASVLSITLWETVHSQFLPSVHSGLPLSQQCLPILVATNWITEFCMPLRCSSFKARHRAPLEPTAPTAVSNGL